MFLDSRDEETPSKSDKKTKKPKEEKPETPDKPKNRKIITKNDESPNDQAIPLVELNQSGFSKQPPPLDRSATSQTELRLDPTKKTAKSGSLPHGSVASFQRGHRRGPSTATRYFYQFLKR